MPEGLEIKPVCPGVSLGMSMSISFEGVGTFRSTLIGMEQDIYFIVKLPPMPDIPSKLYQKNHIVVRYFHDGNVYGFRSTLTGLVKDPYRLYFLSYPEALERINLRKDERYVCLLPAHIGGQNAEKEKMDLRGCISDISLGGCSFECSENGDMAAAGLAVGGMIQLYFRFPGESSWRTVPVVIRALRSDQNRLTLGLQYQWEMNQAAESDTLAAIQTFIDYLRK